MIVREKLIMTGDSERKAFVIAFSSMFNDNVVNSIPVYRTFNRHTFVIYYAVGTQASILQ